MGRENNVSEETPSFRRLAVTIGSLGLYWAWPTLASFQFVLLPDGAVAPINELTRFVIMAVCAVVTLCIGFSSRLKSLLASRRCILAVAVGASLSSFASSCGGFGNVGVLVCAAAIMGVAASVMLYSLCKRIDPTIGDKYIVFTFASMAIVCALVYAFVVAVGGWTGAVLTAFIPLAVCFVQGKGRPEWKASCSSPGFSDARGLARPSRFPWQIVLGFSAFGIAFGISRAVPLGDVGSMLSYDLAHQVSGVLSGLLLVGLAMRAKNLFWTISALGATGFMGTFLAAYLPLEGVAAELVNLFTTLGYTCVELIMWVVIFQIASETTTTFERIYGLGRGLMQLGIVAGISIAYACSYAFGDGVFAVELQISAVCMMAVLFGCFGTRSAFGLWGMEQTSLQSVDGERRGVLSTDEELKALFSSELQLSPRECDVALLLAKGRSKPFIAESLFLSPSTVHTHVSHIYRKTGMHTRQEFLSLVASLLE